MRNCTVNIKYKDKTQSYELRKGLGLQALCLRHETPIEFDCRKSDCGICIIRVKDGDTQLAPAGEKEKDFLQAMAADPDERLACQCRVLSNVDIEVEY